MRMGPSIQGSEVKRASSAAGSVSGLGFGGGRGVLSLVILVVRGGL